MIAKTVPNIVINVPMLFYCVSLVTTPIVVETTFQLPGDTGTKEPSGPTSILSIVASSALLKKWCVYSGKKWE